MSSAAGCARAAISVARPGAEAGGEAGQQPVGDLQPDGIGHRRVVDRVAFDPGENGVIRRGPRAQRRTGRPRTFAGRRIWSTPRATGRRRRAVEGFVARRRATSPGGDGRAGWSTRGRIRRDGRPTRCSGGRGRNRSRRRRQDVSERPPRPPEDRSRRRSVRRGSSRQAGRCRQMKQFDHHLAVGIKPAGYTARAGLTTPNGAPLFRGMRRGPCVVRRDSVKSDSRARSLRRKRPAAAANRDRSFADQTCAAAAKSPRSDGVE